MTMLGHQPVSLAKVDIGNLLVTCCICLSIIVYSLASDSIVASLDHQILVLAIRIGYNKFFLLLLIAFNANLIRENILIFNFEHLIDVYLRVQSELVALKKALTLLLSVFSFVHLLDLYLSGTRELFGLGQRMSLLRGNVSLSLEAGGIRHRER